MRVVLPPHIANHPGLIGSYRPNAAAVIVDDQGRLLWCERVSPPGVWQFPQGGIDPGETPEQAMWRELHEELGLQSPRRWLSIIASLGAPVCYDFPVDIISAFLEAGRPSYIGQAQHVFLLRWSGHDGLLTLDPPPGEAREFTRFQWGGLEMLEHTSPFKREATREALEALELL